MKKQKHGRRVINKLNFIKLFHNIFSNKTPEAISDNNHNLRSHCKAVAQRLNSHYMKNSIRYRGTVLWNIASNRPFALNLIMKARVRARFLLRSTKKNAYY